MENKLVSAIHSMYVERAVSTVHDLVRAQEPLKALTYLRQCLPGFIEDYPVVADLRTKLSAMTGHIEDDAVYRRRYSASPVSPLTDSGMHLRRLQLAARLASESADVLDIGGHDGSFLDAVLRTNPKCAVSLSELNGGEATVSALREKHPTRSVTAAGRFDVVPATVRSNFDFIHCGEVLEHVADPVGLLRNISSALKPGGKAVISVPDAVSWLEPGHIEDLYRSDSWCSHVRMYTAHQLVDALLQADMVSTVLSVDGTFVAITGPWRPPTTSPKTVPAEEDLQKSLAALSPGDTLQIRGPRRLHSEGLLVLAYQGIKLEYT